MCGIASALHILFQVQMPSPMLLGLSALLLVFAQKLLLKYFELETPYYTLVLGFSYTTNVIEVLQAVENRSDGLHTLMRHWLGNGI